MAHLAAGSKAAPQTRRRNGLVGQIMNSVPRLSVVIPTYRRCASVERVLGALARQSVSPAEYEVVVSIDGSEDGTRELLDRYRAPYALHSLWRPSRGRAAAPNAG